jgi:hypothetical protein
MLSCPKFLTTSEYAPRLQARLERVEELLVDAEVRGWSREVERHKAIQHRIRKLLDDLEEGPADAAKG